jgi:signal transduction histidine kinase
MGTNGLISGLKSLISEFRANTFADVKLTTTEKDAIDLSQSHSLALFHICQEALANIAKHAKAKNVQISLWSTSERVLMEIIDDGNGFDMIKISTAIGHGLANMQTRARSMGGDVDITSVIDEGTTIFAWVPRHIQR